MTKERINIILGIKTGIVVWKLCSENETMEQAIVRNGKEDNITLQEAKEVLKSIEEKAA